MEGQALKPDPEGGIAGGLNPALFQQELEQLGLLEFAEEVNFNRLTDTPGDAPPLSARAGGAHAAPVEARNNPTLQPLAPFDVQQCQLANQAAELTTTRATQVLQLGKVSLHELITSYNPRPTASAGTDGSSKRRKTSRGADASGSRGGNKGLRHFSMKVCEKVEAKGRTTYNEVADELVAEMSRVEAANKNGQYDEKNIRRRVYDAINVLMAMDIIQKEKKEILWKGFPKLSHNSLDRLKAERLAKIKEVEQKQLYLQDMIEQQRALKRLLDRPQTPRTTATTQLFLPFILVQTKPDATVEVKVSEDMMDVQFDFHSTPFQIHDDSHVLKKMAEHQARQPQPQQQQLSGPGSLLQWQGANGSSLAAEPALAQLAAAAAAQGSGGGGMPYTFPGAAALLQQQQQQQQAHLMFQQQAMQLGQGQLGQGQQGQGQHAGMHGQSGQALGQQAQGQAGKVQQQGLAQAQVSAHPQMQTLQALHAQQLPPAPRLSLPGPLSLPPLGQAAASHAQQPAFGLASQSMHAPPLHLQQAAAQAGAPLQSGLPPAPALGGIPFLPSMQLPPQLGALLPLPQLPPTGATLVQPAGLSSGGGGALGVSTEPGAAGAAPAVQPQLPPLSAAAAAAFPLVA